MRCPHLLWLRFFGRTSAIAALGVAQLGWEACSNGGTTSASSGTSSSTSSGSGGTAATTGTSSSTSASSGTGGMAPTCKTHGDDLGIVAGFAANPTADDKTLDTIATFGVKWTRLYWAWPWSQPSTAPGNYAPVKQLADAVHARGLKLLVVATGAPKWASGNSNSENAPPVDAHIADFGAFAAGIAQADVDAVEIWNEPNNGGPNASAFWTGTLDPAKEAKLQIAAYQAIKAVRPSTPVITGGLTQVPFQPEDYFKAMLNVPGFDQSFDGVGLHPYMQPNDPSNANATPPNIMLVQTPAIHQMLVSHGVGEKPFWYTEFGTPTGGPGSVSEATQATYFAHYLQGFDALRAQGIHFGVNFVYELEDWSQPNPNSEEPYFGLLHADGSEKPSAPVVRTDAMTVCN